MRRRRIIPAEAGIQSHVISQKIALRPRRSTISVDKRDACPTRPIFIFRGGAATMTIPAKAGIQCIHVISAQAGIHLLICMSLNHKDLQSSKWMPAFAGMMRLKKFKSLKV